MNNNRLVNKSYLVQFYQFSLLLSYSGSFAVLSGAAGLQWPQDVTSGCTPPCAGIRGPTSGGAQPSSRPARCTGRRSISQVFSQEVTLTRPEVIKMQDALSGANLPSGPPRSPKGERGVAASSRTSRANLHTPPTGRRGRGLPEVAARGCRGWALPPAETGRV